MEDNTKGVAAAAANFADAVAQVKSIRPARSANRTVMDGKDDGVSLMESNYRSARLHTRALLGKHEFAPGEIAIWLRQENRHL